MPGMHGRRGVGRLPARSTRQAVSTNARVMTASPDQVWAVLADGWLYPLWVVGASRMREVDDSWPQPGTRLHHSVGTWPLLLDDVTEVVECRPGSRLVLQAHAWPAGTGRCADPPPATRQRHRSGHRGEGDQGSRGAGAERPGGPAAEVAQRREPAPTGLPGRAPSAARGVTEYDAVVVGSGPRRLVAANVLADRGWSVLVLEARPTIGGSQRKATSSGAGYREGLWPGRGSAAPAGAMTIG